MTLPESHDATYQDNIVPNVAAVALMLLLGNSPRILMAERQYTKDKIYRYTMPGGMREPGENIKQAGARELYEETGLKVGLDGLKCVGKPYLINPSTIIQFLFCHIETAAPWQYIRNTEPNKLGPWKWLDMNEFNQLSSLGVYPDIGITGHLDYIRSSLIGKTALLNKYSNDDSWLGWIHERDLRRMYGIV